MFFEEGDTVRIQLRWEDRWGGSTRDFDLRLWDFATDEFVQGVASTFKQEAWATIQLKWLSYEVPKRGYYAAVVSHNSGSVPRWIQIVVWAKVSYIQHYTENGSIGSPAESANPGMLAVGAAPWSDVHTIESFSSRGPTPDGRVKPDIVGADCGQSAVYPESENRAGCWFPGTSQAAPHVAGMAALVRQRFSNYTPEQVADYLKENAELRELPDPGNTWGHGFAQLPTLSPVDTLPTISFANMNWNSVQIQNRIARYIVQHGYEYPTNLVSGSTSTLFQGLRDGDIDVTMEVWDYSQGRVWDDGLAAGDVLSLGTSLGDDWESAFVIPAYLQEQYPDLDSVQDLKEQRYKDLFKTAETGQKARLVSCPIGWACEKINKAQIAGYGLANHVHIVTPSSGAALSEYLYDAYERQEPWLGYQFGTRTSALLLDLVRLEEPPYSDQCWRTTMACAYEDATILIGVNSSLPERAPEVVEFLREWDFNVDDQLRDVVRWKVANYPTTNEDAALYWLEDNAEIWSDWVSDEAATRILAALSGTSPPPSADPCAESLGGDGTVSGEWAAGCESTAQTGSHARYYSFSLAESSEVSIVLESTAGDTYLYLREGDARSGDFLHENDDDGGITRSKIEETLAAGSYTLHH